MRHYETMLMVHPSLDNDQVEVVVERFTALLTERGGQTRTIDRWGRRRLAYEIDDLVEASYVIVDYDLEPDKCKEIEDALPFVEGLMRAKTVNPEPRMRGAST